LGRRRLEEVSGWVGVGMEEGEKRGGGRRRVVVDDDGDWLAT
jgi:hypothetical protein